MTLNLWEIRNYRQIEKILIKKRHYTTISGDDIRGLKEIGKGILSYFNNKNKSTLDKYFGKEKVEVYNFIHGTLVNTSKHKAIFIENIDIDEYLSLGTKSLLNEKLLKVISESLGNEPTFITLNHVIEDLGYDEKILEFKDELSEYSKYQIKFSGRPLTAKDIIKKFDIEILMDDERILPYLVEPYEKLMLVLGMEKEGILFEETLLFICFFPENYLSKDELIKLKKKIVDDDIEAILITNSQYLIDFTRIDSINIISNHKLDNLKSEEEIVDFLFEIYPVYLEKKEIKMRLESTLRRFLISVNIEKYITNNYLGVKGVFIENFECIFILYNYFLVNGINIQLEVVFEENNCFSNYLKEIV